MIHEFSARDGSRIATVDVARLTRIEDIDEVALHVTHTIEDATGRFAGLSGLFESYGLHNLAAGEGVQRFSGELAKS